MLHEIMAAEVDEVVGPKGKHDPERSAVRHGHEDGSVTLGGRRVPVRRPRVRSADDERELPLATYRHFADRDALTAVVLERLLAGVSTRRYARIGEPVGDEVDARARSTSKSAVSREFVSRTRETLTALMTRPLNDLRLAVIMLDGIELRGRCCVVALGIDTDGIKHPLGLWDGSTENATVATTLLANLVERGLDVEQGVLCAIDGAKALRKPIRDVLGTEWSQRTGLITFALVPVRSRVLAAKLLASLLLAIAMLVRCVGVVAACVLIASPGVDGTWSDLAPLIGQSAVFLTTGMVVGVAFGAILLASAPAIVVLFALPMAWAAVASLSFFTDAAPWLDTMRALGPMHEEVMSGAQWAHAGTALALWMLLPLLIGAWRITRREVSV